MKILRFENREIEVEKVHDKGWEGLVLFDQNENQYYLYDLLWHGGRYVDRVLKISKTEYLEFEGLSFPESSQLVRTIAERNSSP